MLDQFFNPLGIVVIGASRDPHKPGYGVVRNLVEVGYGGAIHLVNPSATQILGYPCFASVDDVPDPVDLAVIIVPARFVADAVENCSRRGIKHVIVASGDFGETGPAGQAREQELKNVARQHGVRVIGPNCIGTVDTHTRTNTTFTLGTPRTGDIGFISHSGALCVALIDWAEFAGIGFSRIVSLGNQVDVSETEMLGVLAEDPHTRVITAYLEGVSDGRTFLQVACETSLLKPVVVLKAGRSQGGARAVVSHTGALAGSAEAYAAAFRYSGVLQADSTQDLFNWARALAWQPLPRGRGVAILTNAGGAGVIAADALAANGLELAELSEATRDALISFLPSAASVHNPVDVLAGSGPGVYGLALNALLADEAVDAVVVAMGPPQDWFLPASLAEVVADVSALYRKPVLASFMGVDPRDEAVDILHKRRIPNFGFPEESASVLSAMVARRKWLDRSADFAKEPPGIESYRTAGQQALQQGDLAGLLSAYGIRTLEITLTRDADEAVAVADQIGYPVVLKLASGEVSHKSDVGGVALDLDGVDAVRTAYGTILDTARAALPEVELDGVWVQKMLPGGQEVIVGFRRDMQFGPLVLVGSGGVEVELLRDVAVGIAPLSFLQAEELLDDTLAGKRLKGWRNIPAGDREAVIETMVRLSYLAMDFPSVVELEINPLYVLPKGQGIYAVDVRGTVSTNL